MCGILMRQKEEPIFLFKYIIQIDYFRLETQKLPNISSLYRQVKLVVCSMEVLNIERKQKLQEIFVAL